MLGFVDSACAASITMVGNSTFDTSIVGSDLKLHGSYTLNNAGDETARDVFPTFRLGEWGWSGDPRIVEKGAKESWNIDAQIPLKQLGCAHVASCSSENQSTRGVFPILVRNHYADLNGYKFTAPQIVPLLVGPLNPRETVTVHEPDLQAQLEFHGDGQRFRGELIVQNLTDLRRTVSISGFSSQELGVLDPSQSVTLPPKGEERVKLNVQNFSGTLGSTYPVFALVEWDEDGMRNLVTTSGTVSVARPKHSNLFLIVGVAAILLLGLARYFYKRRRNT